MTGIHDLDEYLQQELLISAFIILRSVLKEGGTFVAKIFRARDSDFLMTQLSSMFRKVFLSKPRSSRASSAEAFVVCKGWTQSRITLNTRNAVRFVTCGDLNGMDSDTSYPIETGENVPDSVSPPRNMPYLEALVASGRAFR